MTHIRFASLIPIVITMALGASPHAAPPAGGAVRIIQTNSAGDNVQIIDPATNRVVGEITGIEVNHGVCVSPDGTTLYVSNEADSTLDVVSRATLKVTRKVPLSGHPNNIAIGKDGRRVYVSISQTPGVVDVIDAAALRKVKSIPINGAVHNTYVTPDGRFVVSGSIPGKSLTVIDSQTEEPVWSIGFEDGVRPIAFDRNADGSTKRLFVQISELHGFAIVDFATRKEVGRVTLPAPPPGVPPNTEGLQGSPSHGIGITPDGKMLWVNSKVNSRVYAYALPDVTLIGNVAVGLDPDWLTFTPDSRRVYVANAGSNSVSVIDTGSIREVARIPVGQAPKRNITAMLADVPAAPASTTLDYDAFKTRVQPIFLTKRPGHARCYACHSQGTPLRLQRLSAGEASWSDEESRRNFEAVQRVVVPGDPLRSKLLTHPLAAEAGGDHFHGGGKHWYSQSDAEWQTLAAWVRGSASP
jgi:YVTN family beta-propeller protein